MSMFTMDNEVQQWGKYTDDYHGSAWAKDVLEIPFLEGLLKSFADEKLKQGNSWKALDVGCGMGKYTTRLLRAGASYVLASDVSAEMVTGAKKETEQFLLAHRSGGPAGIGEADYHVCSAVHLTSIPRIEEAAFDLAICIYVFCNLESKDVKQALAKISKLLRPGATFMVYEPHIVEYLTGTTHQTGHVEYVPKADGTRYKYFEDEGKPQPVCTQSPTSP